MINLGLFAVVFLTTFVLDYVWTKYIAEVGNKKAHAAARWSCAMIPLAAITARAYTSDHLWLVIPAMLGAYASTWWAVQRDLLKEEPKPAEPPPGFQQIAGDQYGAIFRRVPGFCRLGAATHNEMVKNGAPCPGCNPVPLPDNGHRITCTCPECLRG